MSVTLHISGPLAGDGHVIEAEGKTRLADVKKQISSAIVVPVEDFEMVHGGEVMGDMNMLVSGTALCEGDEVVIEPSRRFIAGQRLREMGVGATAAELFEVFQAGEGTDEERAGVVGLMVDYDPDLMHVCGYLGGNALHFAAASGCLAAAKVLITKGAKANARSERCEYIRSAGYTALHFAAFAGQLDIVRYLISVGAEVDARNDDSDTPLCIAASEGKLDVVRELIRHGADINAKGVGGNTPLHLAGISENTELTSELVSLGARFDIENDDGMNADSDTPPPHRPTPFPCLSRNGYWPHRGTPNGDCPLVI